MHSVPAFISSPHLRVQGQSGTEGETVKTGRVQAGKAEGGLSQSWSLLGNKIGWYRVFNIGWVL
jgi:hypothetical protein